MNLAERIIRTSMSELLFSLLLSTFFHFRSEKTHHSLEASKIAYVSVGRDAELQERQFDQLRSSWGKHYYQLGVALNNDKIQISQTPWIYYKSEELKNKSDLEKFLGKIGDRDFTIFLNGDAQAQNSQEATVSGGFYIGDDLIDYYWLKSKLDNPRPKNQFLKMISGIDYGGAVHNLAFTSANLCAVSVTNWRHKVYRERDDSLAFYQGLIAAFRGKSISSEQSLSLFEAYLAGSFADAKNWGRAQISSLAFVNAKLASGPYNPNYFKEDPFPPFSYDFGALAREIAALKTGMPISPRYLLSRNEFVVLPREWKKFYLQFVKSPYFKQVVSSLEAKGSLVDLYADSFAIQDYNFQDTLTAPLSPKRIYFGEESVLRFLSDLKKVKLFLNSASSKEKDKFYELVRCEMSQI